MHRQTFWRWRRSALLGDGPHHILRGFERPDDQSQAETNCKVIFEMRQGIGYRVVHAMYMKNLKVDLMIQDDVNGRYEDTVVGSDGAQRVQDVNRIGTA